MRPDESTVQHEEDGPFLAVLSTEKKVIIRKDRDDD